MKTGRLPRFVATVLAVAALVAPPVGAAAAPATTDPDCEFLSVATSVGDPADIDRAALPPQVPVDSMSCTSTFGSQVMYVYLDDPLDRFLEIARGLEAAGWQGYDEDETPVDVDAIAQTLGPDSEVTVGYRRGPAVVGVGYDATDEFPFALVVVYAYDGEAGGTGIDDPSSISDLRTIADAVPTPAQGGMLIVSAALLTLLLAIPAFLLSRVLSSRYSQLFGWLERGRIGRWREELTKPKNAARRWIVLGIGTVLAAYIACFIDPRFGFNGLSVRLFLTLLITFVLFNVGAWAVVTLVLKRIQPDAKPVLTFHPATLLVVAIAVLLSRLLGFDPGLVFGLVAGTTFAVTLALSREAIVIITGSAYAGGIGLLAWIGYSALTALDPLDAGAVALTELFGGITLEGVSTLPIALVPLATLDGGILFRWRRWVWAVTYAVGLALFMLVLFNLPGGDTPADGDFVRWIIVFVVFAVIATGVWLADYLVRRRTPAAAASGD